jgi:phosphoribosylglycinamide formyltransferase 1
LKKKFSFAYLASNNGNVLACTINAIHLGIIAPFEIKLVIADKDCPALKKAANCNIDTLLMNFNSFKTREEFNLNLSKILFDADVDGLILNYNRLLDKTLIKQYPNSIINTHCALLPSFTGLNPIEKTFKRGVKFAGVTCHLIDEFADNGPIISQAITPVDPNDSLTCLGKKLFDLAVPLQLQAMTYLATGRISCSDSRTVKVIEAQKSNDGLFSPGLEPPLDKIIIEQLLAPNVKTK